MMKKSKVILTITLFCAATSPVVAQTDFSNNEDSMFAPVNNRNVRTDSLGSDKEIPKGLKVWTIDERFGDRQEAQVDTLQHMYMNTPFTSGLRGEYNSLGNLARPASTVSLSTDGWTKGSLSSHSPSTASARPSANSTSPTPTRPSPT